MDRLSKEKRSIVMSRIKSQNTTPERYVRTLLHRAGYRYRLNVRDLPGKPDLLMPKYHIIVDIRGCFWHLHENCPKARIPSSNNEWWHNKLKANVERDQQHVKTWNDTGWRVFIVWSCMIKHINQQNATDVANYLVLSFKRFVSEIDKQVSISWNDFCLWQKEKETHA